MLAYAAAVATQHAAIGLWASRRPTASAHAELGLRRSPPAGLLNGRTCWLRWPGALYFWYNELQIKLPYCGGMYAAPAALVESKGGLCLCRPPSVACCCSPLLSVGLFRS